MKMWGNAFQCMAWKGEKQGQKRWDFWGNTKQVRVDFVEMGALISSFKSVHF